MKCHLGLGKYACSILAVLSATSASHAASIDWLGDLPGGWVGSRAFAISSEGAVVGGLSYAREYQSDDVGADAILWTEQSGLVGLGGLPGLPATVVYGLSDGGLTAVGLAGYGSSVRSRAFRWDINGGMIDLGTLSSSPSVYNTSYAKAVSSDGAVVVGRAKSPDGREAFRWTAEDGMVGLGDLPGGSHSSRAADVSADGSVIVGSGTVDESGVARHRAFYWTLADGMTSMPLPDEAAYSKATAVSADGLTVVGDTGTESTFIHDAFRWTAEAGYQMLGAPTPDTMSINPRDVSADGSRVVGWYGLPAPADPNAQMVRPFIWDVEHGGRDLQQVLVDEYGLPELGEWAISDVRAISADGLVMVGSGRRRNESGVWEETGWRATIPEPATLLSLLSVLPWAILRVGRRR
jgi:probable HAF family extracellular repeat protein